MNAIIDEADDDLSGEEISAEDMTLAKMLSAQTTEALWAALDAGAVIPGEWRVYHKGHLYKGGRRVGAIARELVSRGVAVMAQRRAGKGFDYLIALRASGRIG